MEHSTSAFTSLADLASARVGGRAIGANDEFFAPKSNLVKPEAPIFIPGKFTARGKWMDGWESRRRRTPGHDWCVLKLGMRGRIRGVDVDTSFFTGNYPSHCSIDAIDISSTLTRGQQAGEGGPWVTILPKSPLGGDSHNYFEIPSPESRPFDLSTGSGSSRAQSRDDELSVVPSPAEGRAPSSRSPAWTYVRLNIYPDGGVARLRVYGDVVVDWKEAARGGKTIDVAEIRNGGLVLGASDTHFGAKDNMIMPGRAANMGDGWETRRRRGPGFDWAIVRLGTTADVRRVEIDTNHFKGNYPESASLEGCLAPGVTLAGLGSVDWTDLLPRTPLRPHDRHLFSKELRRVGPISHVRLNIFPDGGISRLRVHGLVART